MNTQNNKIYQLGYNKVDDHNKYLNEEEIDELKEFFENECFNSFIDTHSRKIYDLFINNAIFEPNPNNTDYNDLYYLGVYYQFISVDYDLMKKYYLQAIKKGNVASIDNLGKYYQFTEEKYSLAKIFYLKAIEKGSSDAMNDLGWCYEFHEKKYDLMKKYYLQAIEKGNEKVMCELGYYYGHVEKNYDLMKKYYLMAIEKGNTDAMHRLDLYYIARGTNYDLMKKNYVQAIGRKNKYVTDSTETYCKKNLLNIEDLQNYFNSSIRGNIIIKHYSIFYETYIEENKMIDMFCYNIDNVNLNIENFKFCLFKIINCINYRKLYKFCESRGSCELKNIGHFAKYINKLLYRKNKPEYKKYTNKIFNKRTSQIFMEYLDSHYYEHLKKIFSPGGKGYIKTKNHFELITKQPTINKK